MSNFGSTLENLVVTVSDFVCGYPLFLLLIGGGIFFLIYSKFIPLRYYGHALKLLGEKGDSNQGQISPFEALASAIAATVGIGSIAGVAIAITMGGPGAIFWMWVSSIVGMATKFFEGATAVKYKGYDSEGEIQGGPMYYITSGLGAKWKPLAIFFAISGLVGALCVMQSNQLTEAIITVFTTPAGFENTLLLRFCIGLIICATVSLVVLGGIKRIAKLSAKIVPTMVGIYFVVVFYIIFTNLSDVPSVFVMIFQGAFNLEAGIGGIIGVAVIGARRAALCNEAGIGTASMMHGASTNKEPVKEGLIAMIGPSIDSGLVCTLTTLAILLTGDYMSVAGEVKGLALAMNAFESAIPGYGSYILMIIVLFFSYSTMFSYSYYGVKCSEYLFGVKRGRYYIYFYLVMLVVAAMVPLTVAVGLIDLFYAFMALPTMFSLFMLAPSIKRELKSYLSKIGK
ncbi:MAG: alanine/glycine:cation symporter family protein [Bacteroidales bacterium]